MTEDQLKVQDQLYLVQNYRRDGSCPYCAHCKVVFPIRYCTLALTEAQVPHTMENQAAASVSPDGFCNFYKEESI